jgi:hypothetical protein
MFLLVKRNATPCLLGFTAPGKPEYRWKWERDGRTEIEAE